ncbi:MAG: sulfatase, partial [Planctomycetota bacterium]
MSTAQRLGRTCGALAGVAAMAGLAEGVLLAILYDPFGAGWPARLASVALFAGTYLAAGAVAGLLRGLPVEALSALLRLPQVVSAAAVCGRAGAAYIHPWVRTLARHEMLGPAQGAALMLGVPLLFAGAGVVARRAVASAGWRGAAALAAVGASALLAAPAGGGGRAPLPVPGATREPAPRASQGAGTAPARRAPARNVVLIVADTLRADHLSLYGYPRPTSPALSAYARGGGVFTNAIVQKTKTSPSVASLLTGTYPHTHGIVNCRTRLPDEAVTLAEELQGRGFATHSIVANANVGAAFNYDQGFEAVEEVWSDPQGNDARGVTDAALAWLAGSAAGRRPFFLYVHYIDPHTPYAAPAPYTEMFVGDPFYGRFAHVRVGLGDGSVGSIRPAAFLPGRPTDVDYYVARYDAEIAYLDHHLGRLFHGIERLGLARDTLVIFTSDHGEALSEHDVFFSHGKFAYEETARVPLVVRLPGAVPAGRIVDAVVEVTALAPTVLEALGLAPVEPMEVAGVWDLARGAAPRRRAAFVEAGSDPRGLVAAIRTARWKLIEN